MPDDYKTRLAVFLAQPAEELSRPLWEVAPNDRNTFLAARTRRQFARHTPDEYFETPEHDQRVIDWAETE